MLIASANHSRKSDEGKLSGCHAVLLRELPALRERARFLERNQAAAEDLVHDTIEKALRNWPRFEAGTSVRAWMMRIMQNHFVDGWRHGRRFVERDADQLDGLSQGSQGSQGFWTEPTPAATPMHLLVELEDVAQVLPLVRPALREVFELAHMQRLGQGEIGRRLSVPTKTVATRLHRARRQVRTLLAKRIRDRASSFGLALASAA